VSFCGSVLEVEPYTVEEMYRVAVYTTSSPAWAPHRLEKLEPERLEHFHRKMQANGSAAGTEVWITRPSSRGHSGSGRS